MLKFLNLEWKKFIRSKNFTQNLFKKIFSYIGIFFAGLYISGFIIGSFFLLKEKSPEKDTFLLLNHFIYILFFILFYILSFISSDTFEVKPLMILPVKKKKIIHFYILKSLFHPLILIIILDLIILGGILIFHGYAALPVLIWVLGVSSALAIITLLMLLSEKSPYLMAVSGLFLFLLITYSKKLVEILKPVGNYFYSIYEKPYLSIPLFLFLIFIYAFVYRFFKKRFYLDAGIKAKKKTGKLDNLNLNWTEKYGKTGTFIKNDIRLITRNPRTKQLIYSLLFMVVFGVFILKSSMYKDNDFMVIYWAFLLTGYFIVGYGAMIPSWDGKYYKLLMSQNIRYKEYLEAKWWFLVVSVIFMTLISLPLVFLNPKFFWFLIAMAIFNMGFHSYTVLFTGLLNKKAIDLDQKVKAFQANQDFNAKIFFYSLLRILLPVILFIIIEKTLGLYYAVAALSLIGITGLIFKDKILTKIAKLYAKRKYKLVEAFSSEDD